MDVRPGACPNPYNRNGRGVLDVALVGTAEVDPTLVDIASVTIARADGVGRVVGASSGPPGPAPQMVDRANPFQSGDCSCGAQGTDGLADLLLFFRIDEMNDQLELAALGDGSGVELVLTGSLLDGTVFTASDCILLVPPGGGVPLSVGSNLPDAWIDVAPHDNRHDSGGFAFFERSFDAGVDVTLTAPKRQSYATFLGWRLDGDLVSTHRVLNVTVNDHYQIEAVYGRHRERTPGEK